MPQLRDCQRRERLPGWVRPTARAMFLAAVLGAGGLLVRREWEGLVQALAQAEPLFLNFALAAALSHVGLSYVGWRAVLFADPGREWLIARMFFVGQLGKYLPGGIWSFLAVADYGRDAGVSTKASVAASAVAIAAGLVSGTAMALLFIPHLFAGLLGVSQTLLNGWALAAAAAAIVAAGVVLLAVGKRVGWPCLPVPTGPARFVACTCISAVTWLLGGLTLYWVAAALGMASLPVSLAGLGAVYAAAWLAGFAVFVAPAGLGAREGAMIALLAVVMPVGSAIAIALLARILVTLADFLLGIAFVLVRRPSADAPAARLRHRE